MGRSRDLDCMLGKSSLLYIRILISPAHLLFMSCSRFEESRSNGKLGDGPDCGPEQVVAAGLHSLAIDEKGNVSNLIFISFQFDTCLTISRNTNQVWSWGVNDNAALGRQTSKVPNPNGEGFLSSDDLEMTPAIVTKLAEEGFRAVRVAGGDSVSVAISDAGQMKVWGSFRVS